MMRGVIPYKTGEVVVQAAEQRAVQPIPQDALLTVTLGAILVFVLLMTGGQGE